MTFLKRNALVVVGTTAIAWVLLHLNLQNLKEPLSFGDMLYVYQYQDAFWNKNQIDGLHFGYPLGQDLRIWPSINLVQTLLVGAFTLTTENIFLAVNCAVLMSFSVTAFIVREIAKSIRISGSGQIMVVVSSLLLPWWYGRVQHFDFLFISLSLIPILIYCRTFNKKKSLVFSGIIGFLPGAGGPYIFIFGLTISGLILLYEWLQVKIDFQTTRIMLTSIVGSMIGFISSYIFFVGDSRNSFPGLNRSFLESIHLAGYGFLPFLPLPSTGIPNSSFNLSQVLSIDSLNETTGLSNYGSLTVTCALIVIIVYLAVKMKKGQNFLEFLNSDEKKAMTLLFTVLGGLLFFFAKGGTGVFLSVLVPQIRAWNRLTPLIQILLILVTIKIIDRMKTSWKMPVAVLLTLSSFTSIFTTQFQVDTSRDFRNARLYLSVLQDIAPIGCEILQLPRIKYPFNGDQVKMEDYDHFLLSLIDRKFRWSYGSTNNEIETTVSESIDKIELNEYCGVHIDNDGFMDNQTLLFFQREYGNPTCSADGRYCFFFLGKN